MSECARRRILLYRMDERSPSPLARKIDYPRPDEIELAPRAARRSKVAFLLDPIDPVVSS